MGRSAKELCAMLITRQLKTLSDDEEEAVVDYLDDLGIEVDLDTNPRDMCVMLLEKLMEKEMPGKRVPITAFSNKILETEESKKEEKKIKHEEKKLEKRREKTRKELEKKEKELPGCVVGGELIFVGPYTLIIDPDLGIIKSDDNSGIYGAFISVSPETYNKIFYQFQSPIIEITTKNGYKAFVRISGNHQGMADLIYISPLVATILGMKTSTDSAFLKICTDLPIIREISFTFLGYKKDLDENLPELNRKLAQSVTALNSLSLGMEILVFIKDRVFTVRVDELKTDNDLNIFAGTLPFGETDVPFSINPDI